MWSGGTRSNFVRFRDVDALERLCNEHGVRVANGPGNFAMIAAEEDGELPTVVQCDNGLWANFVPDLIVPLLQPGEVLVVMQAGGDRLEDYLTGSAQAWTVDERGWVKGVRMGLDDIYQKAASAFGVERGDIARCRGEELPENYLLWRGARAVPMAGDADMAQPVAEDACLVDDEGDGPFSPRG